MHGEQVSADVCRDLVRGRTHLQLNPASPSSSLAAWRTSKYWCLQGPCKGEDTPSAKPWSPQHIGNSCKTIFYLCQGRAFLPFFNGIRTKVFQCNHLIPFLLSPGSAPPLAVMAQVTSLASTRPTTSYRAVLCQRRRKLWRLPLSPPWTPAVTRSNLHSSMGSSRCLGQAQAVDAKSKSGEIDCLNFNNLPHVVMTLDLINWFNEA